MSLPRLLSAALVCSVLGAGAGCDRAGAPLDTQQTDPDTDDPLSELVGILISPERITLPLGDEVQLKATGLRADRTTSDLTFAVTWTSSAPETVEVSNRLDREGIAQGVQTGSAEIVASMGSIESPPARAQVTEASLVGLTVQPSSVTIEQGRTVQLSAEAGFSDGTRSDASSQALWSTDDPGVATLASGGRLTAVRAGTTSIQAQWGEVVSSAIPVEVKAQAMPNLTISGVTAEVGGGFVTLSVTSENLGEVGASDFWLDVFLNPPSPPGPGDLGVDFRRIPWLGPGETRRTTFQFPIDPGNHTIVVVIDIEEEVEESDETNNHFSHGLTVASDAIGGPNLTIPYFEYVADSADDMVLYGIEVENTGSEAAGPFYVDIWTHSVEDPTDSGLGDEFTRIEGLPAGSTVTADFFFVDFTSVSGCTYCWSWTMADTNNEVDETDETDNVAGPLEVEL
ncbi:MAG: hypothetical protein EA397_11775 [Deltaproteobacteria bacterium]|nr:MAG: hypothetical protein EA397_11775 [Deltaproteobacteria bacterium]